MSSSKESKLASDLLFGDNSNSFAQYLTGKGKLQLAIESQYFLGNVFVGEVGRLSSCLVHDECIKVFEDEESVDTSDAISDQVREVYSELHITNDNTKIRNTINSTHVANRVLNNHLNDRLNSQLSILDKKTV